MSVNCTEYILKLVSFQWKRSTDRLKEVQACEASRACTSFDQFILQYSVVICKLDLVFCF